MRTYRPVVALALLGAASLAPACGSDDSGPQTDVELDAADASDGSGEDVADDADVADTTADVVPDGSGADAQLDADVDAGDGGIRVPGIDGRVSVLVDEHGMPHIRATTDADAAAVLGYLHARDRFAQMDLRRRVTTGRLPELVGSLAIDNARSNRSTFLTRDGRFLEQALYDAATPETIALLEGYAAGVNAWLAEVAAGDATLPDEFFYPLVSRDVIPPWEPTDSIAAVIALVNSLTNDSAYDLSMGRAWDELGPELAHEVLGPWQVTEAWSVDDYLPVDAKRERGPLVAGPVDLVRARRALAEAAERAATVGSSDGIERLAGSNNWVVGPSRSASGNTLFSNDPHLSMTNPATWYLAHLDSTSAGTGSYDAAGLSFAGLPWIIIGQNADIAWGATTTYFDLSDVYVEELTTDGSGVVFGGEDVPFVRVPVEFRPSDGDVVAEELLVVPHHGPVLSIDREAGVATSLRWTGSDMSGDVNFLTDLMRADSVDAAQTALRQVTSLGQNWVVIDRTGNFGWFPYNTVPLRPWADLASGLVPFLPLPGDGSAEWEGYMDYDDLPQAKNDPRGAVATANNDMVGALADGDPTNDGVPVLQTGPDQAYRQYRIREVLEASTAHTPETMLALVGDTRLSWGADVLPGWIEAIDAAEGSGEGSGAAPVAVDEAGADVLAALRGWAFTCPSGIDGIEVDDDPSVDAGQRAEARGCLAFTAFFHHVRAAVWNDREWPRDPGNAGLLRLELRPETFSDPATWWDDERTADVVETRADILRGALNAAGAQLVELLGDDPEAWLWGRVHTLTLAADLFSSFGVPNFDNGPWVNDGNTWTVDVASPRSPLTDRFSHGSGASARLVCEGEPAGVTCTIQLPGGQRHYRDSANYDDLLRRYLRNEAQPLLFTAAQIDAATTTALEFAP